MRREQCLLFFLILLMIPTSARCQAWSGIIDPSRAVNWSGKGSGIIQNRTTICAILSPGATSAQINSAIASCPSGQVVFLNAGTYSIASGITFAGHSNVTLRGAGPSQTILQFTGGDSCGGLGGDVCVAASSLTWSGNTNPTASWTAGYAQGSTQLTFSPASGLSVGNLINLIQANEASDTNGVFNNDTTTYTIEGGSPGWTISGVDYDQEQFVQIQNISGSVVTVSPGLYMNNWRSGQTPQVILIQSFITGVGIENMTLDHTVSGSSVESGIYFYNAYNCWVKNVKSLNANRNHVWFFVSADIVVRDSYFYGTQNGAQESYGVELYYTSDDLVENNIFDHITSPVVIGNAEGSVIGYNYSVNDVYNVTPSYLQDMYASHDAGTAMNLFEGNDVMFIAGDNIHGTAQLGTFFRNWLSGYQSGKTVQTVPIPLMSYNRAYNVIGNVLGTAGYHNNYQAVLGVSSVNCDTSIYNIGWSSTECGTGYATDTITNSSLMRWGNYDVVNAATRWSGAESSPGAIPYVNAQSTPASQTLPSSFYLSAKPSFWGSMPWPATGPDISGGNGPGGHAYSNPAHLCYANGTLSSGILNFDASTCYGAQASQPLPPTNLTVVVQ